ncbi:MAG: hypothetical protein ACYS21_07925, partial [Planctomycetota bacterium]
WGDPSGSDPNEDGSFEHPYDSIQEVINEANDGDMIIVLNGTYTGVGNYNIDTNGLTVRVRSQSEPQKCIIDCQSNGRGFLFGSGEDANTIVDGFTITGGYSSTNGGAMYCYGSSPTIINCIMTANYAAWSGGAVFLEDNSNAIISQCTITNNSCGSAGGGVESYASSPTIKNCIITANSGKYSGALTSSSGANTTIINCTIVDNSATSGPGGLECWAAGNLAVVNSILWGNTGQQINDDYGTALVDYSDIEITDGNDVWGGVDSNNINVDPCFADPNNEDYHLKASSGRWNPIFYTNGNFNDDYKIDFVDLEIFTRYWLDTGTEIIADLNSDNSVDFADFAVFASSWGQAGENSGGWSFDDANSPCIDAGDPSSDYPLEPAPNGDRINMGGYGNTQYASKSL